MSNDVKNIKSNVEEMNVCCNELNKITNEFKHHYDDVLKEIKVLFNGEREKMFKATRFDKGQGEVVDEDGKRKPNEFKVGDRVVVLNNYKLDHQFKTALVDKSVLPACISIA